MAALAAAPAGAARAAKPAPDLSVVAVSAPATAVAGGTIVVSDAVRNAGTRGAPRSAVAYRLSRDSRLDARDPRLSGTRSVKPLERRARSRGRVTLRLPAGLAAGTYRLFACADGGRRVHERSERNNCRMAARALRVSAAAGSPGPVIGPPTPGPAPGPSATATPTASPTATPTPGDTTPPETSITSGPSGSVQATTATFAFESPESGATFECRLDAAAFAACDSPKVLSGLAPGAHAFEVRALDAAGNRDASPARREWTVLAPDPPGGPEDPPADDPAAEAPPLEASAITGFADSTSFLWTGADPIQSGVQQGALAPATVAVLRGRVLNRMGGGIGGVRVTVLGHPELGRTATRPNGRYDVAVGGGGPVTLRFERRGYVPAQRQADAPWQDFAAVDDLVLVPYDDQVSEVDLGKIQDFAIARGSTVTDGDGARRATLLFAEGTSAEMVMPNGSKQPLPDLHVRATEYTIGDSGPAAMPAALPPSSGYTYAVELSADEAVEAGATEVRFDKPVVTYVDDFLGFPVGAAVPLGYYDRAAGKWVAAPDGTVIAIVGESAGVADVDADGDGDADSPAELAALGITTAEREQLSGLYDTGKRLWRIAVTHFTPWDANWPYGPPPDAMPPPVSPPQPDDAPRPKKECYGDGSIIGCHSQRLGQALPVAGTSFSLDYWSDQVPGRVANRAISIPLTPASVPASLRDVKLEIRVAGRAFSNEFGPAPNQSYAFVWDGLDAYGRQITGSQPVTIRIGYHYGLVKYDNPKDLQASFGSIGGAEFDGARGRMDFTLWRTTRDEAEAPLGGFDARAAGLGGWTLDAHHLYDPRTHSVHMGDGRRVSAEQVITGYAGTGQRPTSGGQGDGGPAATAPLGYANDVEVAPDGSVLVAEISGPNQGRIRRIRPDGVIETYALLPSIPRGIALGPDGGLYVALPDAGKVIRVAPGAGHPITAFAGGGNGGDGTPATSALLPLPIEVAAAPDGSVYITNGNAVKRVGPDGIISTVAGGRSNPPLGDGGPATQAQLGFIDGLAVGTAGELYIGHSDNGSGAGDRIRRVDVGGTITTVAGGSSDPDVLGDGGPGPQARIVSPYGMDVGPDGAVYFAEQRDGGRVRRLGADGIITTFAGSSSAVGAGRGDRGPATRAEVTEPYGIAVAPDGTVYISHRGPQNFTGFVRRVSRPLPIGSGGAGLVPSPDGSQAFAFDAEGRHVRTVDGMTGGTILTFAYDGQGRLSTVTDADGNVTRVDRGGGGLALVAPGGQRTELTLDGDGWLAGIRPPEGAATQAAYTASGLMQTLTDARGGVHKFAFDGAGLLTRDEDPAGAVTTLARSVVPGGYRVTRTSKRSPGPDLVQRYEARGRPEGGTILRSTDTTGGVTEVVSRPDGTQTATYPDDATIDSVTGPDPMWDFYVPALVSLRYKTPDGQSRVTTATRSAPLADPRDPFSFATLTDTSTTNGRTTTNTFTRATRTLATVTPAGRQQTAVVDASGRLTRAERGPGLAPLVIARDGRGRTSKVQEGPHAWTYEYDLANRLLAREDAAGRRTEFDRDGMGRTTLLRSPEGREYGFGYDAGGIRDEVRMPGGAQHDLVYDAADRLRRYTPAGSAGFQALDREADGALKTVTLPSGRTIAYDRDAGGRPTGQSYGTHDATFAYAGGTLRPAEIDWSPSPAGTDQQLAYTWDGDMPKSVAATGLATGRYDYTYDAFLRLSGVKLTSGAYDSTTALTRDTDGLVTGLGAYTLTRSGPGASVSAIGDGTLAMTIGRDAQGDLSARAQTVAGQAVYDAQLTRDDGGLITRKVETVNGVATTIDYTYDDDRRLLAVNRNGTPAETYAYDADGDRTSRRVGAGAPVALGYDGQDRLDTRGGADVYDFGADGFLARRDADTFDYSARGELLRATTPAATVTYGYDGLGRRVSRNQGTETTEYLYGNPGDAFQVTAVRAPSGVLTEYRYDEDGLLFAMERGGARYSIATDQVGTPRVVTDATGAIVKALDFDSFGVPLSDSAPGFFLPFGFAGGLSDPVTGLVRFGLRDYEPGTGRWTARDPLLFDGGQANLYLYAGGDPVGQRDPTGLLCVGGSAYSGFGGGGQLCITDEGFSLCAEAGLGFGTDAGADMGDLAESGASVMAKASAKLGPIGVEVGAELDSSGCLSGDKPTIKTPLGDLNADGYKPPGLGTDVEIGARDHLLKSGKATVQAKVAAKVCGKVSF